MGENNEKVGEGPTIKLVVYYDPNYPSGWISQEKQHPKKIADYFSKKGVQTLGAQELKEFMNVAINEGTAFEKLVIFSQDVIPITIMENVENYYTPTTFMEYLDSGGSVLWIGDIPLYYWGLQEKVKIELHNFGTPTKILGIIPVFSIPKTTVSFSSLAKRIGLKTKWRGQRPIIRDKGIRTLAASEAILGNHYLEIKRKKNLLERFWDCLRTIETFSVANFTLGLSKSVKDDSKNSIHVHENHVNAWVKCFNNYFPNSGFYRIWDYEPMNMSDKKIEELFDITQSICKRLPNKNYLRVVTRQGANFIKNLLDRAFNH